MGLLWVTSGRSVSLPLPVPFTPGWLRQLCAQPLPMEPSALLSGKPGPGLTISWGESQTLGHSRESSVFPVVSHAVNKCFIAIALFAIQLLCMLIPPIWQQEKLLSELHEFIVTCMQNSHSRNGAVIAQLFSRLNSLSFKWRKHWTGALTQHCFRFLSIFKSPPNKLSPLKC